MVKEQEVYGIHAAGKQGLVRERREASKRKGERGYEIRIKKRTKNNQAGVAHAFIPVLRRQRQAEFQASLN